MKIFFLRTIAAAFLVMSLIGCAQFQVFPVQSLAKMSPEEEQRFRAQNQELLEIEAQIDQQQYDKASQNILRFRRTYPRTELYQASRLLEGRVLYGREDYQGAGEIFQEIINLGEEKNPEIWARARFESTLIDEAVGNKDKALATLVGLEKSQPQLPTEIAQAEVPARLANLYSQAGQETLALQYLDKADRGLKLITASNYKADQKAWLAETLFRMGSVRPHRLSEDEYFSAMAGQKRTQMYLVRSMEQNESPWSRRAAEDLISSYQEAWNLLKSQSDSAESSQFKYAGLKALDTLLTETLYRKPTEASHWNDSLKKYFDFALDLREKLSQELYSEKGLNALTKESLKINDVKRPGKTVATQFFKNEVKKPKAGKKNKKDPNL